MTLRTSGKSRLFLLLAILSLGGCKASPAPDSGFLEEGGKMKKVQRDPFHRSWADPNVNLDNYTELLVRPVNINYVAAQNFWGKSTLRSLDDLNKDFREIAEYTQKAFIKAAEKDSKKRFKIVDTPGPKTAVLELALVQLVPTKADLNAIGIAVPYGAVPAGEVVAGTMTKTDDYGKGVAAIEGRIRDGANGNVIYMFADRKSGKPALIDLQAYTWWGKSRYTIDEWAQTLIRWANTPADKKVREPSSFELLIW